MFGGYACKEWGEAWGREGGRGRKGVVFVKLGNNDIVAASPVTVKVN